MPEEAKKEPLLHQKKGEKLVIMGFSPTSRGLAPFNDESWEIWGCNELYMHIPRVDVIFEIHSRKGWGEFFGSAHGKTHLDWLQKAQIPLYMAEKYKDIPMCIEYPWDTIVEKFPHGDYLTNAISEMIALAIYMEYKKISIFGVDMAHSTELGVQKPSVEYWLGIISGMYKLQGWPELFVPTECDLLNVPYIYGKEQESGWRKLFKDKEIYWEQQRIGHANQEANARDVKNQFAGRLAAISEINRIRMP